jgi:hypothetical protein
MISVTVRVVRLFGLPLEICHGLSQRKHTLPHFFSERTVRIFLRGFFIRVEGTLIVIMRCLPKLRAPSTLAFVTQFVILVLLTTTHASASALALASMVGISSMGCFG